MVAVTLSLTEAQTIKILGDFLTAIMPSGVKIFKAQTNRVPEPAQTDFISMTPILRLRLATNIDSYVPTGFEGTIVDTTLTVNTEPPVPIYVGMPLQGAGVAEDTVITAFLTGTGGTGTYSVNISQNVPSSGIGIFSIGVSPIGVTEIEFGSGQQQSEQFTQVTIQLDVHGPSSADNIQIISTLFRDEFATDFFTASGFDLAPLYNSEPHQLPYLNGEQQIEFRWSMDCVLEANPVVTVPVQMATDLAMSGIYDEV